MKKFTRIRVINKKRADAFAIMCTGVVLYLLTSHFFAHIEQYVTILNYGR